MPAVVAADFSEQASLVGCRSPVQLFLGSQSTRLGDRPCSEGSGKAACCPCPSACDLLNAVHARFGFLAEVVIGAQRACEAGHPLLRIQAPAERRMSASPCSTRHHRYTPLLTRSR